MRTDPLFSRLWISLRWLTFTKFLLSMLLKLINYVYPSDYNRKGYIFQNSDKPHGQIIISADKSKQQGFLKKRSCLKPSKADKWNSIFLTKQGRQMKFHFSIGPLPYLAICTCTYITLYYNKYLDLGLPNDMSIISLSELLFGALPGCTLDLLPSSHKQMAITCFTTIKRK